MYCPGATSAVSALPAAGLLSVPWMAAAPPAAAAAVSVKSVTRAVPPWSFTRILSSVREVTTLVMTQVGAVAPIELGKTGTTLPVYWPFCHTVTISVGCPLSNQS